jgi:hypothetical protein
MQVNKGVTFASGPPRSVRFVIKKLRTLQDFNITAVRTQRQLSFTTHPSHAGSRTRRMLARWLKQLFIERVEVL